MVCIDCIHSAWNVNNVYCVECRVVGIASTVYRVHSMLLHDGYILCMALWFCQEWWHCQPVVLSDNLLTDDIW